jgi:hypothetical protein
MLSQASFEAILRDSTKRIEQDIYWQDDEDHSPAVEFRVEIISDKGSPLFIQGRWNVLAGKLTYTMIHQKFGRIYALDMGMAHRNPDGSTAGEVHKHSWREEYQDKWTYEPGDITASVS